METSYLHLMSKWIHETTCVVLKILRIITHMMKAAEKENETPIVFMHSESKKFGYFFAFSYHNGLPWELCNMNPS
jgi:hypothetical protein